MAQVTLPNGQSYDLADPNQRVQARQDNPAYVVDDFGYLLRGSGGAPSSDPSRGGNGNDGGTGSGRQVMPALEGGAGTGSPNGYTGTPLDKPSQLGLAQTMAAAASNQLPSGPGGINLGLIAQQVASGQVSLAQAIASVTGGAATLIAPAAAPPGQVNPAARPVGTGAMPIPIVGRQSGLPGGPWLLIGGGALAILLLRRR